MIPTIKRILYATDLSESARHAFGYAADLARRYDARLTVISVLESFSPFTEAQIKDMMGHEEWDKLKAEQSDRSRAKIKERVTEFCAEMERRIESCSLMVDDIRIPQGMPHLEILKAAEEIKADLIVMGTYGHNILPNAIIGSTARRLVKDSTVPVMVIPLPDDL